MKKIILPVFLVLVIALSSWKYYTAYTVDSVRERIVQSFFDTYNRWNSETLDTTLHFEASGRYNKRIEPYYAQKQFNTSPAYQYYAVYCALDSNAYYNYVSCNYDDAFRTRFKKLFGQEIIKQNVPMAFMNDDGKPAVFRMYNEAAITAAFNKLYLKPSATLKGLNMQKIYDATLKEYCRSSAEVVAAVMEKKPLFEKYAKDYLSLAKTHPKFDGQVLTDSLANSFITPDQNNFRDTPFGYAGHTRIIGIMLRRQCDGSLPALLGCFKTMLKDYDPEYFAKVKDKF